MIQIFIYQKCDNKKYLHQNCEGLITSIYNIIKTKKNTHLQKTGVNKMYYIYNNTIYCSIVLNATIYWHIITK